MGTERFVVVGAGILGLATGRELRRRYPDAEVTVVEKELDVAQHQTSHNSGVVHAGIYYPAGSLKASLCARGRVMLREFCEERQVPYDQCGKVVLARGDSDLPRLAEIEERATANGVPGLRRLARRDLLAIEPHAAGVAALHSPKTAIVDFERVARALADDLDVQLGFEVRKIRARGRQVIVRASHGGEIAADRVVLCAGLQADRVARRAGDRRSPRIVPFRGEYWRLIPARTRLVRGLIYPVPDPAYPFLGVHFTRRIDGTVDLGPNAVMSLAREGYRRRDFRARDVGSTVLWPGTWQMAARNWKAGVRELRGSFSKAAFVAEARRLVPELTQADVVRAPAGVRAQAVDTNGSLVDDFRIGWAGPGGRVMAVRNAPSPGATSSLAIAEYLVAELCKARD